MILALDSMVPRNISQMKGKENQRVKANIFQKIEHDGQHAINDGNLQQSSGTTSGRSNRGTSTGESQDRQTAVPNVASVSKFNSKCLMTLKQR